MIRQIFAALGAASVVALAVPAPAQTPSPVPRATPSYALPSYGSNEETIRGRIVSFDGAYALQVSDDRGFLDNVQLRQGTVINPTGVRLVPGMTVTVRGVNAGRVLAANQIDTPYQLYGYAPPVAVYPYAVYPAYGYPYYGYPGWYGPYDPRVSIGIGFGYRGGWGGRWR